MNRLNLEIEYRQEVLSIWEKYKHLPILMEAEYRRSPILPQFVETDSMLFIGMNPSFTEGSIVHDDHKDIEFYPIHDKNLKDISYFEKLKEISHYCSFPNWSHLDLLFIRETNQKMIEQLTITNIDFIVDQLDISFEIIKKSKPRIIIVANSFASEFFGKKKAKHKAFSQIWKSYNLDFDKDFDNIIGTYRINMGDYEVPIVFTGMLSGQRSLDIGSLERLKWQIKMILETHKN